MNIVKFTSIVDAGGAKEINVSLSTCIMQRSRLGY